VKKYLILIAALAFMATPAHADPRDVPNKSISEYSDLAGASVADGDFIKVYDASTGNWVKTSMEGFAEVTASINGLTASAAELNYNDIATLGTVAASKTLTFDASIDAIVPTGGLMTFQSGSQITMASGSTLAVSGTFTGATLSLTGDLTGDGGDQLHGFLRLQVAASTTPLTAAQCGATVVSAGAAVQPLPEASTVLGCRYTFVCGTADDFDIDPADASDQIGAILNSVAGGTGAAITPSAGDEIRCTDAGASIILEATGANLWSPIGVGNGAWTDVN